MNVAMIGTAAVSVDAGGGSAPEAGGERGAGFGEAVRNVANKHDRKHAAGRHDEAGKAGAESQDLQSDAAGEDETAPTNGAPSAIEFLGRLLAMPTETQAQSLTAANERESDGGDPSGDLQERVVISTVADLAGADTQPTEGSKRIALRVLGMETHFEPRLDGASVVESAAAASADALLETTNPKAGETANRSPRPSFEETLRRLGGKSEPSDGAKPSAPGDAPPSAGSRTRTSSEGKASASFPSIGSANAAVDRQTTAGEGRAPTLGELVNTQIAGRIIDTLSSDAPLVDSNAPTGATSGQMLRMVAGGAALKTLSIQLEPQDLGRVDVSMRLVNGRLAVELAASEPSTAAALAGDRHGLRKILEHAGFALDDAAITIVSRDLGQSGAANATPGAADADRSGSGRGGASGGQDANRQGDRNRPNGGGERRNSQPSEGDTDARARRPTGAVYV